ncbi:PAS domain S-box protein [Streptomyces sp. NPDC047072]|uniref:PAS domain S-box protein n=1 Tax=Streptomyces sp. NPDC047072 TaxID=3154809 RepID=UPI0033FFD2A0
MIIVDDSGIIKLVNARTETLFGYRREELLDRPVELLMPHRFRGGYAAANRQVRPMGAGLDLHGLRRDGTKFPVEISLSPLETTDGLLASAAVRDLSDLPQSRLRSTTGRRCGRRLVRPDPAGRRAGRRAHR